MNYSSTLENFNHLIVGKEYTKSACPSSLAMWICHWQPPCRYLYYFPQYVYLKRLTGLHRVYSHKAFIKRQRMWWSKRGRTQANAGSRRQLTAGTHAPQEPMALYPVMNLWLWARLEENLCFRGFREAANVDPHKSSWSCNQTGLIRQSDKMETLSAELP